jgi:hypothetical protein
VDGIVFVGDSQRAMKDANVESMVNLRSNLAEIGIHLEELPFVFQYNKRDLPNILSLQELEDSLNPDRQHESYEACAVVGQGVFETLKAISKLTLRAVKKKMLGDERSSRPAPLAGTGGSTIWPAASDDSGEPVAAASEERTADLDGGEGAGRPEPTPAAESIGIEDVSFAESPRLEVKHVRVRSNIDILAELDKLRRNATSLPATDRAVRRAAAAMSIDDLLASSLNHRKEISRVFEIELPQGELARGQVVTVGLGLQDKDNTPVGEKKNFSIELNASDVEKLLLSLKFNISSK